MLFKTKVCSKKLHIYPEVEAHVAKQSPAELNELGFLVLETSNLLLKTLKTKNYSKKIGFWIQRISYNVHRLPELLWEESDQSNHLKIKQQSKEDLELLRHRISRTLHTLFSFKESKRMPFKMDSIYEYFGKWDWKKK
ncbi:hypothetical protein [Sporosarcina luteola]|uniref:hypothetical protein n=1 Tax=Sporosarcina luteola TaxID=582850 RepID=UPI002040E24C|nr:hypothetical protein [Sporosarcina luteola]MCM3711041.1 hypothetical protein [Sporosarcina luteola]